MPSSLERFRSNRWSQNGEDGVIREILRRIDPVPQWFCEFGAWDGRYGSNCYTLLERGWRGVMIEAEADRFMQLRQRATHFGDRLVAIHEFVSKEADSPSSLDAILARTPIPRDFGVLSIDIDSWDLAVWRNVHLYTPAVVIIEVDSSHPPPLKVEYNGSGPGSSFSAALAEGEKKGYRLAMHIGNMIFVREDLFPKLSLPQEEVMHPEQLFCSEWLHRDAVSRWKRKARNLSAQRVWAKTAVAVEAAMRRISAR